MGQVAGAVGWVEVASGEATWRAWIVGWRCGRGGRRRGGSRRRVGVFRVAGMAGVVRRTGCQESLANLLMNDDGSCDASRWQWKRKKRLDLQTKTHALGSYPYVENR